MSVKLPSEPGEAHAMMLETVEAARALVQGKEQYYLYEADGHLHEDIGYIALEETGPNLTYGRRQWSNDGPAISFLSASDAAELPDGADVYTLAKFEWLHTGDPSDAGIVGHTEVLVTRSNPDGSRERYDFFPAAPLARAMIADVAGQIAAGDIGVGIPLV